MNHETGGGFKYGVAWVIGFVSGVTFRKLITVKLCVNQTKFH